jgi:hypothetical protein
MRPVWPLRVGRTRESLASSGHSRLSILEPGKPLTMNERVDWAAMSDEEFMALFRQVSETPLPDDD